MNEHKVELNKAKEAIQQASLSPSEKTTMLTSIYGDEGEEETHVVSPYSSYLFFARHRTFAVLTTLIFVISGTTYASTDSLPGEPLYALKVQVLEPIGLATRFNTETKSEYRVSLLQKRVREIEELKNAGRLDNDSGLISSKAAQKNVVDIEATIAVTGGEVATEISVQVENYNTLVEEAFRLKSAIAAESDNSNEDSATATTSTSQTITGTVASSTEEITKTLKEVEDVTKDVTESVNDTTEEIVKPVIKKVVPKVEEVEDIVTPIIKDLGL